MQVRRRADEATEKETMRTTVHPRSRYALYWLHYSKNCWFASMLCRSYNVTHNPDTIYPLSPFLPYV